MGNGKPLRERASLAFKPRSNEEWDEWVEAIESSGLSPPEFIRLLFANYRSQTLIAQYVQDEESETESDKESLSSVLEEVEPHENAVSLSPETLQAIREIVYEVHDSVDDDDEDTVSAHQVAELLIIVMSEFQKVAEAHDIQAALLHVSAQYAIEPMRDELNISDLTLQERMFLSRALQEVTKIRSQSGYHSYIDGVKKMDAIVRSYLAQVHDENDEQPSVDD